MREGEIVVWLVGKGKGREVGSLVHIFVADGTKRSAILIEIDEQKRFLFIYF